MQRKPQHRRQRQYKNHHIRHDIPTRNTIKRSFLTNAFPMQVLVPVESYGGTGEDGEGYAEDGVEENEDEC